MLTNFFKVTKERGEELAIEYGIKFMETSAKSSVNVEAAFYTLARDIKAKMERKLVSHLITLFNKFLKIYAIYSLLSSFEKFILSE